VRRLTRYSIRSLLVLVTLCALAFGWFRYCDAGRQRELSALAEIKQICQIPMAGHCPDDDTVWCGSCAHGYAMLNSPGPDWLDEALARRGIDSFQRVEQFRLVLGKYDPQILDQLTQLRSLEVLELDCDRIDPRELKQLEQALPGTEIRLATRQPYE
jgi:hypothetical protein